MKTLKNLYRLVSPGFRKLYLEYTVDFRPRYGYSKPPHPELFKLIDSGRENYREVLQKTLSFRDNLQAIRKAGTETGASPSWNNGFLPGLDIIALYTIVSEYRPSRFIEIGSGNSTRVAHKARREQGIDMEIVSVDPTPRRKIEGIADSILKKPLEDMDLSLFETLKENDILFIDSSHRIFPNSDSTVILIEIIPRLNKGVIVHFHDIYLPYDYPQFMCDRFYSEQYGIAVMLLANPAKFRLMLPAYYVSEDKELPGIIAPFWEHENLRGVERHGCSFWFRII
jgi:hypothetical protein